MGRLAGGIIKLKIQALFLHGERVFGDTTLRLSKERIMRNNRWSTGRPVTSLNRLRYFFLKARACCFRCTDNMRTFVYFFSCSSSRVPSYFSRYTWWKKKKRRERERERERVRRRGKSRRGMRKTKKSRDKARERERERERERKNANWS